MLNTVIVIDDSEADRYLVKRTLESTGVTKRILEFPTAFEALEYLDQDGRFEQETSPCPPPTLFLLDINMPRMNGFEFLDAVASRIASGKWPRTCLAVVMLTSSTNGRDRDRASRFDIVVDYIVKPLSAEATVRAISVASDALP